MPRWLNCIFAAVLMLMAFAMMASTWLWLMGLAPQPPEDILFGRAMLGVPLLTVSAIILWADF